MDRNDLELVVAVREHGSLAAAARSLDVAAPVVTKRLAALELRLGHRLFQRTTRRVTPTAEGETVCERAGPLLQGFLALEAELLERKSEPTGVIRLAATFGFGRLWLGPALATFQERYPRVSIQLQLTEQLPDMAAEGLDGAVWLWQVHGRQAESVSRRLARNQRVLVATPGYLRQHGMPATPDALQQHACLVVRENANAHHQRFDTWTLYKGSSNTPEHIKVQGPLSSNSGELVRDWCLAGRGIMLRSLWDVAHLLASGRLVRVLEGHAMREADIQWLAPLRQDSPRRIRLLIDFLVAQFQDTPWETRLPAALRAEPPG